MQRALRWAALRGPVPGMWLWRIIGFLFLGIGAVGIFLPVMPTTIFWIIAALAFARSDHAWRDWIYGRPGIGPQVQLFIERGILTRQSKLAALGGMMLASFVSLALLWRSPVALVITLGLVAIGAIVVLTRPDH